MGEQYETNILAGKLKSNITVSPQSYHIIPIPNFNKNLSIFTFYVLTWEQQFFWFPENHAFLEKWQVSWEKYRRINWVGRKDGRERVTYGLQDYPIMTESLMQSLHPIKDEGIGHSEQESTC